MLVITLQQDKWAKRVEHALSNGLVLMIESVGENIDPLLDLNDAVNRLKSLLPLADVFFELFDFFLSEHGH